MSPKDISLKLKTFAHKEFSGREFSAEEIIKYKIENNYLFSFFIIYVFLYL